MYIVLFLDQDTYEFNMTLHPTLEEAEEAFKALLPRFDIKVIDGTLMDVHGEEPHVYQIECDGKLAEEVSLRRDVLVAAEKISYEAANT